MSRREQQYLLEQLNVVREAMRRGNGRAPLLLDSVIEGLRHPQFFVITEEVYHG